ncbi:MAG: hypothetical protein M1832_000912 [Thelocarpon impressellum]|nr:MAG: hypothetical protein M1832_000912 [Thelocarpon impressellum]
MSSGATLQLFPPPPSKSKTPKRKASRRKIVKPPSTASDRGKPASPTQEIVIHVSEKSSVSSPIRSPTQDATSRSSTPSSHRLKRSKATRRQSLLSDSPTLVRSASNASSAVPIRSMFPQYNPGLPLAQQNYRPTQSSPTHIPKELISKQPYSPSLWSAQSPGKGLSPGRGQGSPGGTPAAVTTFPPELFENPAPQYSSHEELIELWEACNGQTTAGKGATFALQMIREGTVNPASGEFKPTENEAFSFGSSKGQAYYDMQTLRASAVDKTFSECDIRRHDPRTGAIIPVMTLNLPSTIEHPQDGLVTLLYPKIAAMMALDGAQSQAPTAPALPEATASDVVSRAAARETCRLAWDADSAAYYLLHPGLRGGAGQRFMMLIEGTAGFDVPGARGTIRVVEAETQRTLVSLECGSCTLLVDTRATGSVESFYIIDVCVSAVVAVAIVEGRRLRAQAGKEPLPLSAPPLKSPMAATAAGADRGVEEAGVPKTDASFPKPADGILSVLTVAFQFLVWLLSLVFGAVAATVVGVAACFGKKK